MSNYYHDYVFDYLTNDIITIKSTYDEPILLVGDFNSRTNIVTYFEDIFEHEGSILEENPHKLFFENPGIINRANEDKYLNNNGRKLIELCKISDLKIVNGRVGRDKHIGNYTGYTSRVKSTIDYALVSMDVSSSIEDFYIDDSDYITKKDVKCRWKDNLRDDYTPAFNIDNIQRVNSILTETLTKMVSTTQNIIDDLYVNFKDIFITPAISTKKR